MLPRDKRTLDCSGEFSGKLSEGPSDEQLREMCLAIYFQMLGYILLIPGTFAQFLETCQKEVILSPKLVQESAQSILGPGEVPSDLKVPIATRLLLQETTDHTTVDATE